MKIISLLTSNIPFLIFVIAALIGVIKKIKSNAENTSSPMPSFGRQSNYPSPHKYAGNEAKRRAYPEPMVQSSRNVPVASADKSLNMMTDPVAKDQQNQINTSSEPNQKLNIPANQIIQGVVWSEIMGPPRSKQPFMRRK